MDHNLDSLNLENSMGVDFESPDNIEVSQADLELPSTSHDESIPMDFQQIEEQPIMMDTGSEEIIDFMGDQFSLQEYSVQDNETTGLTTTAESNQNVLTSQAETLMDLQLNPQSAFVTENPTVISVKAEVPARGTTTKKLERPQIAPLPRQVAIAPKPPPLAAKTFTGTIGPKPVALVKKVALSNVMQATSKGNTVLAQVGKQLVMMPAGTQKLKLVSAGSGTSAVQYVRASGDQASLLQTKDQKPVMMAKVIMPGVLVSQSSSNQSAVLAKILPSTSAKSTQPRFVTMQPKAVPITIGNKVIMSSPTKQGGKMGKTKQIISIQSPSPKLLPASSGTTTKKVVISSNPAQSVILKPAAAPKTAQISSDGNVVIDGQHTQLHQINVPGKGIQYIRLVTNPNAGKTKGSGSLLSVPSKFVLTDSKEGGKTLVRIAPIVPKSSVSQPVRSSQSLLAPLSPVPDTKNLNLSELLETSSKDMEASAENSREETEEIDSKAALQSLIDSTVHEDDMHLSLTEVEIEYKKPPPAYERRRLQVKKSPKPRHKSIDMMESSQRDEDARLIMIPSSYDMSNNDMIVPDEVSSHDESHRSLLSMESEPLNTYTSPLTPQAASESEVVAELGLRPRKACNCTKSQCLKLYCDCFANGEFCNRCNCNNCHNNLENEELRQKAIRGCLERNPNAFRPKIGKTKAGGPEIIRRHNKGCNCKRSGCLKNYCECFEAKIACTAMCRCVGCRNVEETLEHFRRAELPARRPLPPHHARRTASNAGPHAKQPCTFMTSEVIEAVCQCLLAAAGEGQAGAGAGAGGDREPLRDVIDEFARCLQDIIGAAHHAPTATTTQPLLNQGAT